VFHRDRAPVLFGHRGKITHGAPTFAGRQVARGAEAYVIALLFAHGRDGFYGFGMRTRHTGDCINLGALPVNHAHAMEDKD